LCFAHTGVVLRCSLDKGGHGACDNGCVDGASVVDSSSYILISYRSCAASDQCGCRYQASSKRILCDVLTILEVMST